MARQSYVCMSQCISYPPFLLHKTYCDLGDDAERDTGDIVEERTLRRRDLRASTARRENSAKRKRPRRISGSGLMVRARDSSGPCADRHDAAYGDRDSQIRPGRARATRNIPTIRGASLLIYEYLLILIAIARAGKRTELSTKLS